ncbi:Rossmann-fold NAD(P)-binding domain-containing protein [Noviherbaspirillum galbum]|uniref:Nucleoside-diphosphate sugar epimerase n=1 Tax=Noviherbaspirillum galbum TaxID=2709383 RepID=A0A6B3SQY4_9BURK|nr:nucleoside-diphosphate sugar epimerase [Noviherbaspirillum galbum]NEX63051.1 nucleoside-diphosphate sugar epimerase [Noviherbaspirillum galbum]
MNDLERNGGAQRKVLLAGATGLVGKSLLQGLLADDSVSSVHALLRRQVDISHRKLTTHLTDFSSLPALPPLDEVYLALGTTIKVAGSQAAFRAVDFDANLAVAKAARDAGATRAGLVSAMGADVRSSLFYSRVKGELEDALAGLGFSALVIARPSMLVGDCEALGQPVRSGERIALHAGRLLRPFIPANYLPVNASDVAAALLARVPAARGREVLLSGAMQPARRH